MDEEKVLSEVKKSKSNFQLQKSRFIRNSSLHHAPLHS